MKPDVRWCDTYRRGLAELQGEGWPWHLARDTRDFEAFVAGELALTTQPGPNGVTETELWALLDGEFVGRISIRHALNDSLKIVGGHIGYDTVPSYRGRGVATRMLAAALPIARDLGLTEVLLTCDDTNVGSIRVIENNGGRLTATRVIDPARPAKRYYWIYL